LLEPEELQQCTQSDQVTFAETDFKDDDFAEPRAPRERQIVGANSAMMYGPLGEWIGGYRKTNLFRTDKTWATAGSGFTTFNLPPPLQNVTLAICMDLNPFPPADWTLETGPYELADYCRSQGTDLLVLLNAWLDPDHGAGDEPSWRTLQYWAARLRPLWYGEAVVNSVPSGSRSGRATTVVVCNRTGEENGVTFAGTSAVFRMTRAHGKPRLVDMMTKEEEGIYVWTIQVDPSNIS